MQTIITNEDFAVFMAGVGEFSTRQEREQENRCLSRKSHGGEFATLSHPMMPDNVANAAKESPEIPLY
jgi:hypothetical protein